MLNPAHNSVTIFRLALCIALGGCANASAQHQRSGETLESALTLFAEGSSGHRLEIITRAGGFNEATAILTFQGRTWRTSDAECPAFRQALNELQTLPTLRPGPMLLQPGSRPDNPFPPYRPHGETWTIRTQLYAPDWSAIDAEMQGRSGPYVFWLSDVVPVIKSCSL